MHMITVVIPNRPHTLVLTPHLHPSASRPCPRHRCPSSSLVISHPSSSLVVVPRPRPHLSLSLMLLCCHPSYPRPASSTFFSSLLHCPLSSSSLSLFIFILAPRLPQNPTPPARNTSDQTDQTNDTGVEAAKLDCCVYKDLSLTPLPSFPALLPQMLLNAPPQSLLLLSSSSPPSSKFPPLPGKHPIQPT